MKKNKLLPGILFACLFTTFMNVSCTKDEPAKVIEQFTMKVSNTPVSVKSLSTKIQKGAANKNYLQIIATLTNNDVAFVEIFYEDIGEKCTLQVASDPRADFGYHSTSPIEENWYEASINYKGGSGDIIVTENDLNTRTIKGTFSGTAVSTINQLDKKIITDGSFVISY